MKRDMIHLSNCGWGQMAGLYEYKGTFYKSKQYFFYLSNAD
jgi:hypothetical protein